MSHLLCISPTEECDDNEVLAEEQEFIEVPPRKIGWWLEKNIK